MSPSRDSSTSGSLEILISSKRLSGSRLYSEARYDCCISLCKCKSLQHAQNSTNIKLFFRFVHRLGCGYAATPSSRLTSCVRSRYFSSLISQYNRRRLLAAPLNTPASTLTAR